MDTFHIDPDLARQLSRDIADSACYQPISSHSLPAAATPTTADFFQLVTAALDNIDSRRQLLDADLHHVADIGTATARAAQLGDDTAATAFNTISTGVK